MDVDSEAGEREVEGLQMVPAGGRHGPMWVVFGLGMCMGVGGQVRKAGSLGVSGKIERHGHFEDILKVEWKGCALMLGLFHLFLCVNPQPIFSFLCASGG